MRRAPIAVTMSPGRKPARAAAPPGETELRGQSIYSNPREMTASDFSALVAVADPNGDSAADSVMGGGREGLGVHRYSSAGPPLSSGSSVSPIALDGGLCWSSSPARTRRGRRRNQRRSRKPVGAHGNQRK